MRNAGRRSSEASTGSYWVCEQDMQTEVTAELLLTELRPAPQSQRQPSLHGIGADECVVQQKVPSNLEPTRETPSFLQQLLSDDGGDCSGQAWQ